MGRIGRAALRQAQGNPEVQVAGINDLVPIDQAAYLLRHDSVHGRFPQEVEGQDSKLRMGDDLVPYHSESNPAEIPWRDVDVVIESTGAFRSRDDAAGHLTAGAGKVIISAPSDDADVTIVPGVNDDDYHSGSHDVISMASCTTNCSAVVLKVLHDSFGVEKGLFTTVHAYTSSQALVDGPTRKHRRGRAAALSLVPTTTGAAVATERVLPELEGRLDGMAVRAPIPDGSLLDLVARVEESVDEATVMSAFTAAAQDHMKGILAVTEYELVSADIVGRTESALVDAPSTRVLGDFDVKILAWYDNEMGYAARLVDLATNLVS